jgi:hypothetical protein
MTQEEEIKAMLAKIYKSTNLGSARQLLGTNIHCKEDGAIFLSQIVFIDSTLKLFHVDRTYGVTTLLDEKLSWISRRKWK